jgi:hypothetical protein
MSKLQIYSYNFYLRLANYLSSSRSSRSFILQEWMALTNCTGSLRRSVDVNITELTLVRATRNTNTRATKNGSKVLISKCGEGYRHCPTA